ncbi:hypothetical protein J19TS2_23200 [Cohnella xylanilytica]|uniref:sensor histidine kinase n=1 Tax=Cohnella xylanilytica TaxID=557555 RepID=UPI001B05BCE1|nr:HAMP domain-containing sensor histidine kinase [Cohnella xylanilytica]GIO12765.1 hypothetical protein J19TS2_23200 [Cohnella xylanilytica]
MLYYFFALLAAAIVLLAVNARSPANRWAAFFLGFASIGGLSDTMKQAGLTTAAQAVEFLNLTATPCGVLVFAIVYSGLLDRRRKLVALLQWLLFLPVPVMAAVGLTGPEFHLDDWLLLAWCGPYLLLSCLLLLASLWREKNAARRRSRFVTTVIFVPTLLAVLVLIYAAQAVAPDFPFFKYVSVFIFYSLAAGLLFAFVYGVLGVKLRIERDPLESAMKTARSGTNLLNHTIKNEIRKIAISAENLRKTLAEDGGEEALQHVRMIERASDHMHAMVSRIHSRTKDIVLRETPVRLDELAANVVLEYRERLQGRTIKIGYHAGCRPTVMADPVHLREALGNVLANAIEAAPEGEGRIEVRLEAGRRGVRLTVADNGPGIPPDEAAQAFEPFYSTKNREGNFGLGLSYVYRVMRELGGSAELASREGAGTTAALVFPRKKVIRLDRGENDGGGTDPGVDRGG